VAWISGEVPLSSVEGCSDMSLSMCISFSISDMKKRFARVRRYSEVRKASESISVLFLMNKRKIKEQA
jgi:hypothetical protein